MDKQSAAPTLYPSVPGDIQEEDIVGQNSLVALYPANSLYVGSGEREALLIGAPGRGNWLCSSCKQ